MKTHIVRFAALFSLLLGAAGVIRAQIGNNFSVPPSCIAASASSTAYTCSGSSNAGAPAAGDMIFFKADVANTGSATLNVNSSSAATIKKQGGSANLVANDLLASQWVLLIFDGTNWQMQGQLGNAGSTPSTPFFTYGTQMGSAGLAGTGSSKIALNGFYLPVQVASASHLVINFNTADNTAGHNVDFGLYSNCTPGATATLVASTGPKQIAATGYNSIAISQGTVTLPVGAYCWAYTNTVTWTGVFAKCNADGAGPCAIPSWTTDGLLNPGHWDASITASVSGTLNSTITVPSANYGNLEPILAIIAP